jgi:hypothetical protein
MGTKSPARRTMPPGAFLRECFELRDGGLLFWKTRPASHFRTTSFRSAQSNANNWNSAHAGQAAFTTDCHGYRMGLLLTGGQRFKLYAHRVIWKMLNDIEPDEIDHIDGDRQNNRPENIRNVDRAENTKNRSLSRRNKSGCHGVTWAARERKWAVQAPITAKGLGYFSDLEAAIAARKAAERAAKFHINHGRI